MTGDLTVSPCLACGVDTRVPEQRRFIAEGSPLVVPLCDADACAWSEATEKTMRADKLGGQPEADVRIRVAFRDWLDRRVAELRNAGAPSGELRARLDALATHAGLPPARGSTP